MAEYSIWPATSGPGASSPDTPVTLGTEFVLSQPGWLVGMRFWRADTAITGSVLGRVWQAINSTSGTAVSGTDSAFTLDGTGWQRANPAAPVPLAAATKYKATCFFPSGYSATASYWASGPGASGITNGVLTAPNKAGSVGGDTQGCFGYGASITYPANGSGSGACYWVDVVISDVDPSEGGPVSLEGTATGAASATGTLSAARALAGSSPAASHAVGALGVARALAGSASAAAVALGSLTVTRPRAAGAGWGTLIGIGDAIRADAEELANATYDSCPVCGGPIDVAFGLMNCPMGHWQEPVGTPVRW